LPYRLGRIHCERGHKDAKPETMIPIPPEMQ
jgi:hypothetical protein